MTDTLAFLSAHEVLARYRDGSLTPGEYLAALQEHIALVQPVVNAVTGELLPLEDAVAESTRRWADGTARPLEGLPVVVKEAQSIAGHVVTLGSPLIGDAVSEDTHPIVERIVEAGGIPFLRATTPEFCIAAYTRSEMWGITRNPWNPEFAVGGSSGGSGAALAAGYAPLATGSDIGGSTRIPASMNGVVGYKPPFGRVPTVPGNYMDDFCTDGPMGRTVLDVALMQNVIAGQHPMDQMSLPDRAPLAPDADLNGRRIALATTFGDYRVTAEVRAAVAGTAAWLRTAGAVVEEVEVPFEHKHIADTAFSHFGSSFVPWIESVLDGRTDRAEPATLQAIELARAAYDEIGPLGCEERKVEVHLVLARLFQDYDALVCPVASIPAFRADEYYEDGITIDGEHHASHVEAMLTLPFNIANRNPVLAVPVARSADDVPIGVQVVARPYDDATVFDVGLAIERGRGDWYTTDAQRPSLATSAG